MVPRLPCPVPWQAPWQGKRDADSGGGCPIPPFHFSLSLFGFFVLDRPTRTAPAERGETGATPPFNRWRGSARRGVSHPVSHRVSHPPRRWGGRSRLYVSLREGSPARVRAGRRAETSGPMLDRLIRAFLVVGGVSVGCAWTWPGAFPEADPVAVLVSDTTPRTRTAPSSRGTTWRPAWRCSSPANFSSAHPGSGSPGWASVWGAGPAGRAGPFRLRRMGRRSSSARSITRSEPSRARLPNG